VGAIRRPKLQFEKKKNIKKIEPNVSIPKGVVQTRKLTGPVNEVRLLGGGDNAGVYKDLGGEGVRPRSIKGGEETSTIGESRASEKRKGYETRRSGRKIPTPPHRLIACAGQARREMHAACPCTKKAQSDG